MSGLKTATTDLSVKEAVDRMVAQVKEEGWHLFARIDHAQEARDKGLELRPTELILFGNPEIGTALMQDQQVSAIDLPMKAVAWEDKDGQVHMVCNEMKWLKDRHNLTDDQTIEDIDEVVTKVCHSAVKID